jgi:hypothetical protein
MIINENKFKDVYDYKTLPQLKKQYSVKSIPSPSKILAYKDKGIEFMTQVLHNPNHALHNTLKTSLADGRNVHNILDTNNIDKEKYNAKQNELYQAVKEEFVAKIEPLITEVWGHEKGLLIPNEYGGRFDSVGLLEGEAMVWDYKKINKRKTKSQITNYIQQCVAYAQAHNKMYNTSINHIAVMIIYGTEPDKVGSEVFIIEGDELKTHLNNFNLKLKTYQNEQIK